MPERKRLERKLWVRLPAYTLGVIELEGEPDTATLYRDAMNRNGLMVLLVESACGERTSKLVNPHHVVMIEMAP